MAARARRALGIAAHADGSPALAFTLLRQLFSAEGAPVADIATAAVRAWPGGRRPPQLHDV